MGFREEVAQLCHVIHLFQNSVRGLKQELFNIKFVTRKLIWNSVIGGKYKTADKDQIINYFRKHGYKITQEQIQLIVFIYSSRKDGFLSEDDLWQIFKPMHMKAVAEVERVRERREVLSACHQTHYKVVDLLVDIMRKTVQFLKVGQGMKWNVVGEEAEAFQISPLDAGQYLCQLYSFQMYIHEYVPEMTKKEVEVVLRHIMRAQKHSQKTLKEYFIPCSYKGNGVNPNFRREKQEVMEMKGVQLMKYHWQTVGYVGGGMKKYPIYLQQTSDSINGSINSAYQSQKR